MAIYYWKKCPKCGQTYDRYSSYTTGKYHSGCPFLTCRNCGCTFVDKSIKEPALKPYKPVEYSLIGCILTLLFPCGIMGIVFLAYGISSLTVWSLIVGSIFFVAYLYLVISSYRSRKSFKEADRREYEESLSRLNNREYAWALKNAGFKVPEEFLK